MKEVPAFFLRVISPNPKNVFSGWYAVYDGGDAIKLCNGRSDAFPDLYRVKEIHATVCPALNPGINLCDSGTSEARFFAYDPADKKDQALLVFRNLRTGRFSCLEEELVTSEALAN